MEISEVKNIWNEVKEEIQSELTQEEQTSTEKLKQKRPKLNYARLGIPVGAELTYTKNASIHVTVMSENKVCYNGEICSLTAATKKIMDLPENSSIQPTPYWNYKDENLMERYNSVFPVED